MKSLVAVVANIPTKVINNPFLNH